MSKSKKRSPTPTPTATTAVAALAPRYEIVRELGRGGTSIVYLGRERASGTEVAIKVIRAKYLGDEETLSRFAREARYVGELHHPNVVALRSVVELGESGLALVMDHVPGRTLKQLIQESGPLSPERTESVLRDIAGALGAAHAMGIVHRDVKPENIFVDENGRALLADFGVARSMSNDTQLTMSGVAIGTPAYMAPEQIDGLPLDGRGDIYSLGLVGWEMLSGKRPWDGSSLYAVIYQQKHQQLPDVRDLRPDVPDRLADVIAGSIEKDRSARWQSAGEMVAALDGGAIRHVPRPRAELEPDHTRQFVRPFVTPEETHAVVAADPMQAVLREIEAAEHVERTSPVTRRRLMLGAGLAAALLLATLGVVLSGSAEGSRVRDRPTVSMAGEIASPQPTPAGAPLGSVTDSAAGIAQIDAARPETLQVVNPPLDVPEEMPRNAVAPPAADQTGIAPDRDRAAPATVAAGPAVAAASPPASVPVRPPSARVSIAAGGAHSCLVMANGRVFCWGGNDRGQLGTGTTARRTSPEAVATEQRFASVVSGLSHSCALTASGAAWCWGENGQGQLGDRSSSDRRAPVPVAGDLSFRLIAAGAAHTCALAGDGKAWCWGAGANGQLGAGEAGASAAPVAVATQRRFSSLTAGWGFACGLADDGSVECWGENSSGQLGDGSRTDRRAPTPVRTDARFVSVAAGSHHACGITASGDAWCWGRNARGQLGDGTKNDHAVPVRVGTTARFVAISAGAVHTCAITSGGSTYCWGQNSYGQLGDGSTTDRPQPVAVAGDHALAVVRAFGSHTCGATASGEAFCWGYNLEGQLGDGSRVHRSRPVYVAPPHVP